MAAKSVIVIGSGIVGASIAYHLALRGAEVTVLDADDLGGIATAASWAWINATAGNPEPYARLRMRSMQMWHRLGTALPALDVRWTGGLTWDLPAADLHAFCDEHVSWGYPVRIVDRAEAARLEPGLADPPGIAAHVEVEGSVEPRQAARTLLSDAVMRGATVLPRTLAEGLSISAGRVRAVRTSAGTIPADETVVAAGVATSGLLAATGQSLPLDTPPGLLVWTLPARPILKGLVMSPDLHMRQRRDGALVAGADFGGSDPGDDATAAAQACFSRMQAMLKSGENLRYDRYTVGSRPTPSDGYPAVGRTPGLAGLYVAVMHSGVTLAPAIGRFVADEIMDGRRDAMLEPYGLERFTSPG